jgi:hypothetical protein
MTMAIRSIDREYLTPISSTSRELTHDVWIAILLSGMGPYGRAITQPLVKYRQHPTQAVGAGGVRISFVCRIIRSMKRQRHIDHNLSESLDKIVEVINLKSAKTRYNVLAAKVIREKSIHLNVRQNLFKKPLLPRGWMIIRELISGRYFKFSDSCFTALRDFLR